MRYRRTAQFDVDFRRLPAEHRKLFQQVVFEHFIPALERGAHLGKAPWPRRLRIHKIDDVYSLTWSFASPDGRALFTFTVEDDGSGELLITWLAVGYHNIYR
ncbi:hypothetical protein GCM10009530_17770 [Microbispora corallina]|uniref:Cytotoxic translational repressor of toxin-antitoxin stability system n=1 Tax=Microbispora corallina TaxID=83302 RepID=A0ABQ4FY50_9ACTN|nr:hypothetical protein [Microbispora corallina]GIH39736.1 hypothetical protein Mco01_27360 [Microbispora corallina]